MRARTEISLDIRCKNTVEQVPALRIDRETIEIDEAGDVAPVILHVSAPAFVGSILRSDRGPDQSRQPLLQRNMLRGFTLRSASLE
jgi:hypothetical protein